MKVLIMNCILSIISPCESVPFLFLEERNPNKYYCWSENAFVFYPFNLKKVPK